MTFADNSMFDLMDQANSFFLLAAPSFLLWPSRHALTETAAAVASVTDYYTLLEKSSTTIVLKARHRVSSHIKRAGNVLLLRTSPYFWNSG
jgi:hypothetical protein